MFHNNATNKFTIRNTPCLKSGHDHKKVGDQFPQCVMIFNSGVGAKNVTKSVLRAWRKTKMMRFLLVSRGKVSGKPTYHQILANFPIHDDFYGKPQENDEDRFRGHITEQWKKMQKSFRGLNAAHELNLKSSVREDNAQKSFHLDLTDDDLPWFTTQQYAHAVTVFDGAKHQSLIYKTLLSDFDRNRTSAFVFMRSDYACDRYHCDQIDNEQDLKQAQQEAYNYTQKALITLANTLCVPAGSDFKGEPLIALPQKQTAQKFCNGQVTARETTPVLSLK